MEIKKFLKVFRLPEQTIGIVPFFFGALDANYRNWNVLLPLGLGVFLISVSFFVINEYVDSFDTDKNNPRKTGSINFLQNRNLILGLYLLLTISGSILFIIHGQFFPLILCLFFGNFYSAPPLRLKGRFPWDMIAPLIAWGFVPYSMPFSLTHLSYESVLSVASLSLVMFGIPMQGIHFLADAESDKEAGIQNSCVVLGYRNFLRVIDKFAIAGLIGFTYLIYKHERWWYYPVILASIYELLVIGYARAAIYQPGLLRLQSIATRSYGKGILVFLLILIFQIWVLTR